MPGRAGVPVTIDAGDTFRALFDAHPFPLWVYDPDTFAILEVNEAALRQYGYTRDEFLRLTVSDLRLARQAPTLPAPPGERPPPLVDSKDTWLHRRRDGTTFHARVTSRAIQVNGRAARLVVAEDVTDRRREADALWESHVLLGEHRRMEDELRESEARFRALIEGAPIGIAIVRGERVLYANPACRNIFGYTATQDLSALPLPSFIAPSHRDAVVDRMRRRGLGETIDGPIEVFGLRANGSTFPYEVDTSTLQLADGPAMVAFITDVTERLRTERDLLESQEQLRQAQKMEAIGRLAGGVAHDFNNVLTAILSTSELLLTDLANDDPAREDIEQIRQAGQRAADLTRQLLAFSRQQMLKPRPISLNTIVAEMDKMLRRIIREDIELRIALAPKLGTVLADPGQIEQVIMNLAVNARDAMPSGGTLTISTADVEIDDAAAARLVYVPPGPYVCLKVQDTGRGMDAGTQARVFEPFFTTKEHGKGTGLGLSTVYGIVKQSGGSIFVDSETGQGATFTIYLPRVDAAAETPQPQQIDPTVRGQAETILLVEDDGLVRHLARTVLQRAGYEVLEAADAAAALAICERHDGPIDMLITDVVMPRMSGRELVERLPPRRAGMPVLFVSGYSDEVIRSQGSLFPGAELLPKPFTPNALTAKVREILLRSRR